VQLFNLFAESSWDSENDRDGYRHRATAIGNRLGASLLGGSLYELDPGEGTWPYHYELGSRASGYQALLAAEPTLEYWDGEA
jgi:hypothetical protein